MLTALALTAAASAQTAPAWIDDVVAAMDAADPTGGWVAAPAIPQAAKTKADILIESFRDGSTSTGYHGDVTLKRGIVGAVSPDGTQALILAENIEVCDFELGCDFLAVGSLGRIDLTRCVSPLCGGEPAALAAASAAYLVVDVVIGRDGTESFEVRDLLVGLDNAFAGIEYDEID